MSTKPKRRVSDRAREVSDGVRGKSAYELALEHGFDGTVVEWLDSLRGANGDPGILVRGEQGPKGDPGPMGPMPKHQWRGTELRFEIDVGKWGQYVDLRGPSGFGGGVGSQGIQGPVGPQGPPGTGVTPVSGSTFFAPRYFSRSYFGVRYFTEVSAETGFELRE